MSDIENVLRAAFFALDEITTKVDGTGFAESKEFDTCLEVMAMLSAQLAAPASEPEPTHAEREHEISIDCWCKPVRDSEEPGVIIHNRTSLVH